MDYWERQKKPENRKRRMFVSESRLKSIIFLLKLQR